MLEGARWRREQAARENIVLAYSTAALSRAKKMPRLNALLRDMTPREPQSPEQLREGMLAWAKAAGLKVERRG